MATVDLPEEKVRHDIRSRDRELDLREREVAAKEKELERSRWSNPLVIGLIAATLGLLGNLVVAILNNKATQDSERRRAQSSLVVELIRTSDTEAATKNLKFFLDHGLIDDPDGKIRKSLQDQTAAPVLPASSAFSSFLTRFDAKVPGVLEITSEPTGGAITVDGNLKGFTNERLVVSGGEHEVSVTLGQKRYIKKVTIVPGESTELKFP